MNNKKNYKHRNQVRIIGGVCRGRKLVFEPAEGLRPTPDSVRERLFNWLGQDLTGKTVLDLFAGSGALGLEAASRNAKQVIAVEKNKQTAENLRQNAQNLSLNQISVLNTDGLLYLCGGEQKFDVVFLDPPFAWSEWNKAFTFLKNRLEKNAFVYIEAGQIPDCPSWIEVFREGSSGMSKFQLLRCCTTD